MMLRILVACLLLFSCCQADYFPEIRVFHSQDEMGIACAQRLIDIIIENQKKGKPTVIGLATGSTPIPVYQSLIRIVKEQKIDLSQVTTFNLDEYIGLPADHPQSFRHYMYEHLFKELIWSVTNPLGIKVENIHFPEGSDLESAIRYESLLKEKGPIDVQILGIGSNGHIGFSEPGSSFEGETHIVTLTETTRKDNARFFNDNLSQVPQAAITMGIGTILRAKTIFLLATGNNKKSILRDSLYGPISEEIPATALRLHPGVTAFLDEQAAGGCHE